MSSAPPAPVDLSNELVECVRRLTLNAPHDTSAEHLLAGVRSITDAYEAMEAKIQAAERKMAALEAKFEASEQENAALRAEVAELKKIDERLAAPRKKAIDITDNRKRRVDSSEKQMRLNQNPRSAERAYGIGKKGKELMAKEGILTVQDLVNLHDEGGEQAIYDLCKGLGISEYCAQMAAYSVGLSAYHINQLKSVKIEDVQREQKKEEDVANKEVKKEEEKEEKREDMKKEQGDIIKREIEEVNEDEVKMEINKDIKEEEAGDYGAEEAGASDGETESQGTETTTDEQSSSLDDGNDEEEDVKTR